MKRKLAVGAMWVAAIAAMLAIYFLREHGQDDGRTVTSGDAPIHEAEEGEAHRERRAGMETAPIPEGAPTTFRGDRRHTGRSPLAGPGSAQLRWAFETGGRITAQPVVAPDGSIYVGSHDHFLYAISPHGQERWRRDLRGPIWATAAIDAEGNVYAGSDADLFVSYTPSGELRWRLHTEGDMDTGVTLAADGTVHFAAGRELWAVTSGGEVRWRFQARSKIFSIPAVDDDGTVYFGAQDDRFYAVAADGRLRWSYRTGEDNDASPVIGDDGTIYFGSDNHRVYALTRDGEVRWSQELGGYVRAPVGLGRDGTVLVGVYGPRPRVVGLDPSTGEERWYFPVTVADNAQVGVASGPLVDREGYIYFGAHDDYVYSLAPDGDLRWVYQAHGDIDSSPTLAPDGSLLLGCDDHLLYALRTDESALGATDPQGSEEPESAQQEVEGAAEGAEAADPEGRGASED